jgi:hypothetical protein
VLELENEYIARDRLVSLRTRLQLFGCEWSYRDRPKPFLQTDYAAGKAALRVDPQGRDSLRIERVARERMLTAIEVTALNVPAPEGVDPGQRTQPQKMDAYSRGRGDFCDGVSIEGRHRHSGQGHRSHD